MKHLYLLLIFFISTDSFSQTNTFPESGSVGVGTTNPTAKLDVNGAFKATYNASGERNIIMEAPNTGNHRGNGTQNPTGLVYRIINVPADGDPILQVRSTGEAVRLFVEHNGYTGAKDNSAWFGGSYDNYFKSKIGIGTSSPSAKLHVEGLTKLNPGLSNNNFLQVTSNTANQLNLLFYTNNIARWNLFTASDNKLYFRKADESGNGGVKMVIDGDNVGIGTSTPEHRLHVSSGVRFRRTAISTTSASAENGWVRDSWLTGNYNPPKWNQSTARWVRTSGNYNDIGGIMWQDEGTYFIREKAGNQTEYTNSELLNKAFLFADMFTGNVGIGTNNPGSWKLAVNGKIRAKEIKVETGWSDFVFDESYNLPTLEEVEKHIKEKGHLKDIPSAKEVEENGVYLGEMDAKLLQKIEELTLYVIELNKKVIEQEKIIKNIRKKNE